MISVRSRKIFLCKIREFRESLPKLPSIGTLSQFMTILTDMKEASKGVDSIDVGTFPEFVNLIKSCNDSDFDWIKRTMVKLEVFETVVKIEKIRVN